MRHLLQRSGLCLSAFLAPVAAAQTGPGLVLVPFEPGAGAELSAEAFFTPTEANVTGADVDLSIFDANGRFAIPVGAMIGDWSGINISHFGFEFTQFEISSSDAALPDQLVDISVALGGDFGLGEVLDDWQLGYTIGVGYAGTAPFNDGDAWYGLANLFAVKPIDRDTRWLVGINYDGNRVFLPDVPLPAVTYFGRLSETVTYGLGFPFSSLTWTPTDRWTIDLRSAVFFSITGRATYDVTDDLSLFASFVRRSEAFTVSGGADHRRLLFTQQRVELGLNYGLGAGVSLTVAGGWAFDQEFDVGFDSRDPAGLRDLDDSGYIRAGIDLRF